MYARRRQPTVGNEAPVRYLLVDSTGPPEPRLQNGVAMKRAAREEDADVRQPPKRDYDPSASRGQAMLSAPGAPSHSCATCSTPDAR